MSNYPVDPSDLRGTGTRGVMAAGAGLGLWVVNSLIHIPVLGWAIGGALLVFGAMGLLGKNRSNRAPGGLLMAAGAAGLATILLLGAGGLALVAYGGWNIFKFVRGLRDRA
jgi:hypothetical protein